LIIATVSCPLAVSASDFDRASSAQGRSSSSPAASRRATIRLTLDFSRPSNVTSCAAVIAPLTDTSSRVCTAEGE
jgi:hypothetical protein